MSAIFSELRNNVILLSVYLWVGIFIIQPHKEERFMYVIYPLICYNAAHATNTFKQVLHDLLSKSRASIPRSLPKFVLWIIFFIYGILSLARILAQVRAFSAPMHVYTHLTSPSTVCLGKEWYRFPSSFFIPEGSRALFVKSAFDGLLPGRFPTEGTLPGWRSGTWEIPKGMNDLNLEDTSHHVSIFF